MGTFVTGNTALPVDRTNAPGLGPAAQTYECDATYLNYLTGALGDLRTNETWLNVKSFGAKGDGVTDDTAAILAAVTAAGTVGAISRTVYLPRGVYRVSMSTAGIRVPAGVEVVGDGYDSVIQVIPFTPGDNTSYIVLLYGPNCTFRDFRIDGNKAALNLSLVVTSGGGRLFYPDVSVYSADGSIDNVLFENVWAHDLFGVNFESFAFMTGNTVANVRFVNCKAYNNNGTGFHVTGGIDITPAADWKGAGSHLLNNGSVINCESHDNTWMGISCYGVKNTRILGGRYYNNTTHGINLEWNVNTLVVGAKTDNNGRAGIGMYGPTDTTLSGCRIHDNNTSSQTSGAEIRSAMGQWFTGTPKPAVIQDRLEITGCFVSPPSGGKHLYYESADSAIFGAIAPTTGGPDPGLILINQPDAANWKIQNGLGADRYTPTVKFANLQVRNPLNTGDVGELTGTLAKSTTAGVTTFTGTAQFQSAQTSRYLFEANRRYRLRMKMRMNDANGEWNVFAQDAATNKIGWTTLKANALRVGVWSYHEAILQIGANPCRLQVMLGTAPTGGTSTFDVEYLTADELISDVAQGTWNTLAMRRIWHGTAAPTTGAWEVGDIVWNDAPASGNQSNIGWVCITAGTPGTWREFGLVSADTDQPSFGNNTTAGQVSINGPAGSNRQFVASTAGSTRWILRANANAETGSNAGSDFEFSARDDTGALLSSPITITRATGVTNIAKLTVSNGTPILKVLSATATWDPPSTVTGALSTATTVTLTGAAVGDNVIASFNNVLPDGCSLVASVSATNTVKVQLANFSGSTQDLLSGTLRVSVVQF